MMMCLQKTTTTANKNKTNKQKRQSKIINPTVMTIIMVPNVIKHCDDILGTQTHSLKWYLYL